MSKLRKRSNFTIMPNELIRDSSMSWKAKGIYSYLASQDDGWDFYVDEIETRSTDGVTAVRTGLRELEDAGYIERHRINGEGGKFHYDYEIYETATAKKGQPHAENPHTVSTATAKPHTNNTNSTRKTKKEDINIKQKACTERMDLFYKSLQSYIGEYSKETIRAFYDYWTEGNKSKTKMKWELQQTWDLPRRLSRWKGSNGSQIKKTPKRVNQFAGVQRVGMPAPAGQDNGEWMR